MNGLPKIKLLDDGCQTGWECIHGLRKQHQNICRSIPPNFSDSATKDYYRDLEKRIEHENMKRKLVR